MSQSDQVELWRSVMDGNLEKYIRASSKLKLGTVTTDEADMVGQVKAGKIPVRLYVWSVNEDFEDLEDAPEVDNWDQISYINRPLEIHKEEMTPLMVVPVFLCDHCFHMCGGETFLRRRRDAQKVSSEDVGSSTGAEEGKEIFNQPVESCCNDAEIKLVRIQGIEPKMEIPFSWVVNSLKNPEHFLHICVCVKVPNLNAA
ncbi:hypothetical protein POTOM_055467 [Populus tomentosa]|uniref:Autophagy protein 5 n=1 Tax=Populus tomentosa TaxID=118781 RepID=A0A8X8C5S4_POPTO|nr:hypothetical protein POTOM_055467 [Populus tomentosa]